MPFDESDIISLDPDVTIYFDGLLLLCPDEQDNKVCEVLAVNHPTHQLYVDVNVGQPGSSLPFLRIGDMVRTTGLEIYKTTPAGVSKYTGPRLPGVDPLETAVDFQKLHEHAMPDYEGGHPGEIIIRDGVLYVAKVKGPARIENDAGCKTYEVLGTQLGARIDFALDKIIVAWGRGSSGSVELPRPEDIDEFGPHPKYTIWISNSDPIPPLPTTIDFPLLYKGIKGAGDPCRLYFERCPTVPPGAADPYPAAADPYHILTTPRVPCIPGVIGG